MDIHDTDTLFSGLKALAETAFPKKCNTCGRIYTTPEEFIAETQHLRPDHSGLKSAMEDDGTTIIEVFRNCRCGSTLMDAFSDRRDFSEAGEKRRKRFAELLAFLVETHHMTMNEARAELLKVMRTGKSEILSQLPPPQKK